MWLEHFSERERGKNYGLHVCVLVQIGVEILTFHGTIFRCCGLSEVKCHEGRTLTDTPSSFQQEEVCSLNTESLVEVDPVATLISDTRSPELGEINPVVYKPFSRWYRVLAAPANKAEGARAERQRTSVP